MEDYSMSTPSPQAFPRELLEQPIDARRRYFETKVVAHQRLKEVYDTLLHTIRYPAGTSLILVFGPTGVGKTTLLQRIVKQLIEDAAADPSTSPGHIPVVAMEAASPDSGNFSWKDYFTRALIALDEPMLTNKVTYDVSGIHRDERGQLIIDEAQHFKKMTSGRRLLDQMDTLKSLANMTNTVHVLIGTYDLQGLMGLSAQLSRRSAEIHFPRYHAEQPEDAKEFKKLLRTLQRHLPFVEEPDLESHYEYFYERCLGCTGMLKTLLNKALGAALEQQERTLTPKYWERQAEPPQKLKHMLQEIREGEEILKEDATHVQDLRTLLGLSDLSLGSEPLQKSTTPPSIQPASPSKARRSRVGQRSAKRDPIGKEEIRAG
jgi:GTPase SAR1 family protein